jgi:SM-20-related protein
VNLLSNLPLNSNQNNTRLFTKISEDILQQGFSVQVAALDDDLSQSLYHLAVEQVQFAHAGIGREFNFHQNGFVRTDKICWIEGTSKAGAQWIDWTKKVQDYLNKTLMLGLFSFESHFAHYPPGSFYKRHLDAFRGETNRVLSIVLYLNPQWQLDDGGELVIYHGTENKRLTTVTPLLGTLAVFLSEEFPHEVKTTLRDRYSIAGWYRVNNSTTTRVDPPS